jgi:hypothetical protein
MVKTSATALAMLLLAGPAAAAEIDACKYLLVSDLAEDPNHIVDELRAQGLARGFTMITSPSEVPRADEFRSCVMVGSWVSGITSGQLAIRVVDAVTGAPIAGATLSATNWWGLDRTMRGAVAEIYRVLGYTGYDEAIYRTRMDRLYPSRPTLAITEAEVMERPVRDGIEGIWSDAEDQYRLAIVAGLDRTGPDYVAVVLRSNAPLWRAGEIKAELSRTATPNVFASTYFMLNKQPLATTFALEKDGVLRAPIRTPVGDSSVSLLRVWPSAAP